MEIKSTISLQPLSSFQRNVHSQNGEDGVIEEILKRMGSATSMDRWCVEFGAMDGIYLSNTCNLIRQHGYRAVMIEADRGSYEQLCRNLPSDQVIKIRQLVTFDGPASLDNILRTTPIPADFDFLSIDIDGCDYYIIESLQAYRPKLICVEFNHSIPNEVDFVQPRDFGVKQGASAGALVRLARGKGYRLAAVTLCNLLLVRDDLLAAVVGEAEPSVESLRNDSDTRTFVFFGYDGSVLTSRSPLRLPWHRIELEPAHLQQLPGILRRFPSDYGLLQKALFLAYVLLRFPRSLSRILSEGVKKMRR